MVKFIILIAIFPLVQNHSFAQEKSISWFVIGTGGKELNIEKKLFSISIGQPIVQTSNLNKINYSEGYQFTKVSKPLFIRSFNINNAISNEKVLVYPNPADQILNIKLASVLLNRLQPIEVINCLGQTVLNKTCFSLKEELNLTNLPSGVYYLRLVSDMWSNPQINKFIIDHK